jgi:putative transposase
LKVHLVWIPKCRKKVLTGQVALRVRDVRGQIAMEHEISILSGKVASDDIHVLAAYRPHVDVSMIVEWLKGIRSRMHLQEFAHLRKSIWGRHLWARGYLAVGTANLTGEMCTGESIQKNLDTIISGQYIRDFLRGKVTRKKGQLRTDVGTDDDAYNQLKKRGLGKRILFTDRKDLTNEEIIFGYRGQHNFERAFRDMKDPYFMRFSPPHHWTEQMLRVHAFYSVLALTLVSLLDRRVHQVGIDISQSRLMEQLKKIKEITDYYPAQTADKLHIGGRACWERSITRQNRQKNQIFDAPNRNQCWVS